MTFFSWIPCGLQVAYTHLQHYEKKNNMGQCAPSASVPPPAYSGKDAQECEWLQYFRQEARPSPYHFQQERNDGVTYNGYVVGLLSLHRALKEGIWWWKRFKLMEIVPLAANFSNKCTGSDTTVLPGCVTTLFWCRSNLGHLLKNPKLFTHAHVIMLSKVQFDEICHALA